MQVVTVFVLLSLTTSALGCSCIPGQTEHDKYCRGDFGKTAIRIRCLKPQVCDKKDRLAFNCISKYYLSRNVESENKTYFGVQVTTSTT